jgi:hypothetical protein
MVKEARFSRRAWVFGLVAALLLAPGASRANGSLVDLALHATPVGTPVWQPVDFHLFSAPVGTFENGFAQFFEIQPELLPPPNHVFDPTFKIIPGAPHRPPYSEELEEGVARLGLRDALLFRASQFKIPNGVYLVWMTVPGPRAPKGSSPDFRTGPIIPNSLFPIQVRGVATRNGAEFDPFLAFVDVPPTTQFPIPFAGDGHSHFPIFVADLLEFGPAGTKAPGLYQYALTMTDAAGNGWNLSIRFLVL